MTPLFLAFGFVPQWLMGLLDAINGAFFFPQLANINVLRKMSWCSSFSGVYHCQIPVLYFLPRGRHNTLLSAVFLYNIHRRNTLLMRNQVIALYYWLFSKVKRSIPVEDFEVKQHCSRHTFHSPLISVCEQGETRFAWTRTDEEMRLAMSPCGRFCSGFVPPTRQQFLTPLCPFSATDIFVRAIFFMSIVCHCSQKRRYVSVVVKSRPVNHGALFWHLISLQTGRIHILFFSP